MAARARWPKEITRISNKHSTVWTTSFDVRKKDLAPVPTRPPRAHAVITTVTHTHDTHVRILVTTWPALGLASRCDNEHETDANKTASKRCQSAGRNLTGECKKKVYRIHRCSAANVCAGVLGLQRCKHVKAQIIDPVLVRCRCSVGCGLTNGHFLVCCCELNAVHLEGKQAVEAVGFRNWICESTARRRPCLGLSGLRTWPQPFSKESPKAGSYGHNFLQSAWTFSAHQQTHECCS